jgi:diacylglycerol O-acyltransferase
LHARNASVVYTAATIFAGILYWIYTLLRKKESAMAKLPTAPPDTPTDPMQTCNGRRMSFNSQVMVHGAFPPAAGVATPIINVAMLFDRCPELEALKGYFSKLIVYHRFRAIPVFDEGVWSFRNADFNIDDHVHCCTAADEADMRRLIDVIIARPLSPNIPFWEVHVIHTAASPGVSCVVTRVHHAIADGISLVASINKVFCDESGDSLKMEEAPINGGGASKEQMSTMKKIVKVAKAFFAVLYIGISPYDSDIKYTAPNKKTLVQTTRKTLYFPSVKLEFVKQLKNKAGVTVNDILLAATSGAIRRYSIFRGDDFSGPKKMHNRALVPLAFFRPLKDLIDPNRGMSNKFAFLSVDMPVAAATAAERVAACHETMGELKTSPIALVQLWVQDNLLCLLPLALQRQIGFDIFSRHSLVFSNVPGPVKPITLAGEKVVSMQVIFPNFLPQVILVSYAGSVFNCMVVDDKLITNQEKLGEFYLDDLREVAAHFGVDCSDAAMLCDKTPGKEFDMISSM